MTNDRWKYIILQVSDLPEKAQRFIKMMDIDVSSLKLMHLTPCPNGTFFKCFNKPKSWKPNRDCAAIAEYGAIYFFCDYKQVGVAIHELTHIYLTQSIIFEGIKYDLRAMSEKFIKQYGINALTAYARISVLENNWVEVICEIVATYGRRGQFNKIKELLNQKVEV
jgi:hypothetical protein